MKEEKAADNTGNALGKESKAGSRDFFGHKIGRMAVEFYRSPTVPFILSLVVALMAASAAGRLRLETDLAGLLPRSFESVSDLEALKSRYGGEGYLVVVAQDADREALQRFADNIAPKLAVLPGVQYVENRKPTEFFRERALYFLSVQDLEAIRERLQKRKEWEVLNANPFYVDLLDTKPPPLDFSDILEKYKKQGAGGSLFGNSDSPYYIDEQQRLIAVLVKPTGLASDLRFAQDIVHSVQTLIAGMDLQSYAPTMRVELTGRYKKRVDLQVQIRRDLILGCIIAQALMFFYVVYRFRRKAAVIFIFAPLVLGLALTFGFAGLIFGELNILTAFIGTILMGIGIDHGIHLLSNYEAECSGKQCDSSSIFRTFSIIGRAVVASAFTMIAAFAGLALSEFKAFFQFGVIAAVGSIFILVSYLVFLPILFGFADRLNWSPRMVQGTGAWTYSRFVSGWAKWVLAVFVIVSLAAVSGLSKVSFNYDFSSLDDTNISSYKLDETVNQILGHSQTPLVISVPNGSDAADFTTSVRKRMKEYGSKNSVDFILSESDLVPQDQKAKHRILQEINHILQFARSEKLEPEQRKHLEEAKRMAQALPFTSRDIPEEVLRKFHGAGSGELSSILVFPSVKLTRGDLVLNLARELQDISTGGNAVIRAAGEPMILADMLKMIRQEAVPVLATVLALVFVGMWLLLGSVSLTLFCLMPGVLTVLATVGIWSYSGLQFNYLNIIMIPLLLGIGVSSGLHMIIRLRAWRDVSFTLARSFPPITGSMLTIIFGFGALVLAHHPGLRSLGELAVLGLAINLGICLLGMAALAKILCGSPHRTVPQVFQSCIETCDCS